MPDQMFYNTGIGTYVWIISNRKEMKSTGLVRLIDARELGTKMRKSLGDKRKELTTEAIEEITHLYSNATFDSSDKRVKVMSNEEFGFARLTIERPLRRVWRVDEEILLSAPSSIRAKLEKLSGQTYLSEKEAENAVISAGFIGKEVKGAMKAIATTDPLANPMSGKKHNFEPDPELRDSENISLPTGFIHMSETDQMDAVEKQAEEHLLKEIHPYVSDAWIDHSKTKIGYELPVSRQFYTYTAPRPVSEIRKEIDSIEQDILSLMKELR
jgi:type I restriction enzyme M protein